MLANVFRTLVNSLFKENIFWKRKKKAINVLTIFFIFYKSDVKIFLKLIVNQYLKGTR